MPTRMKDIIGLEVKLDSGIDGYVTHADRTKGITIHSIDTDQETYCVNKQDLINKLKSFGHPEAVANRIYHEMFTAIVKMILSGYVTNVRFSYREPSWEIIHILRTETGKVMAYAFK